MMHFKAKPCSKLDDTEYTALEASYSLQICDMCGNKRKCYWLDDLDLNGIVGLDVCKRCLKINFDKDVE